MLAATSARAAGYDYMSNRELTGMLGGQGGTRNAPAGFKMFQELSYRFGYITWFNFQLNVAFGSRNCYAPPRAFTDCSGFSGTSLETILGVKLKFDTGLPNLVPYFKLGGGIVYIFAPGNADDSIAPVGRVGGGVKYYVIPRLAVGGEINLSVGPLFVGCGAGCRDLTRYVAIDFAAGVDWNF